MKNLRQCGREVSFVTTLPGPCSDLSRLFAIKKTLYLLPYENAMIAVRTLVALLFFILLAPSSGFCSGDSIFSGLSSLVGKYLELDTRHAQAAEDTWYPQPFKDTKQSTRSELNDILDKALQILLGDGIMESKKKIDALMQANISLREQIADMEMQRITAPASKKVYELWKDDISDIDKGITQCRQLIAENEQSVANMKQVIRARLQEAGMNLTPAEVDSLVNTVTGTDTLAAMVVLKNVQAVLTKLQDNLLDSNENIQIAKKYYGLFLLSTEAYLRELERFESTIDNQYLPRLNQLRQENKKLMHETAALAKQDSRYENNYKAQKITEQAARTYEEVLVGQKKMVAQRTAQVKKIYAFAENTYRTVSIAHSLYESMNEGLSSYESLMALPLIEAVPFANKDLENKFMELTQHLGK